ncbi:MAG: glucuronate isomerase [Propionibacteriaceae bacterium]|jgi:glucuronate isomerase|nr:glucuronate isomerase [Propionibacteriaceae bacterium]
MADSDQFLLASPQASAIFEAIRGLPIIDYHSHLDAAQLLADEPFADLAEVWLGSDHYKWRLMRANGVPEELITGAAPGWDKFAAFAQTMEKAVGNPVYEWSHLELRRYFGIGQCLCASHAQEIWDRANALLATGDFLPRRLVERANVEIAVTTDDPLDDLGQHRALSAGRTSFRVLPSFRPDAFLDIGNPGFPDYLARGGVTSLAELVDVLQARMEHFAALGCRLSDHGLDTFYFAQGEAEAVLRRRVSGQPLNPGEAAAYQSAILTKMLHLEREFGWTSQLHFGAARRQNLPGTAAVGHNAGFDSVGTQADIVDHIRRLLQSAHADGGLPDLIAYPLNPGDWPMALTLLGDFQGESRLQLGAAWWFNDHFAGIHQQLEMVAANGLLGNFTGMLTDSRSLLSYSRHEYFRRILASHLAGWLGEGRVRQLDRLIETAIDIAYRNPKALFDAR